MGNKTSAYSSRGLARAWWAALLLLKVSSIQVTKGEMRAVFSDGREKTYATSVFKYFSNSNTTYVQGSVPAVFLVGDDICLAKDLNITGKVVVTDLSHSACFMLKALQNVERAGAAAFVYVGVWNPTGLMSYLHYSWHPSTGEPNRLLAVDLALIDVGFAELKDWRIGKMEGVTVSISAPHVTVYQELFGSALWLGCMQIILPIFAAMTCARASLETFRLLQVSAQIKQRAILSAGGDGSAMSRRDNMLDAHIALSICSIEALSTLAIGIVLACGNFGPMILPFSFHWSMFT
jgi:hypothetical protein